MRKLFASLGMVLTLLLGGSTLPSFAQASTVVQDMGTPPKPTKQDRPYKATARDKAALKGSPTGFSTFACPCFNYVIAQQAFPAGATGDGFAANLPVENTFIKTTAGVPAPDGHVLAQLHIKSAGNESVEFGITRDAALFGDWQPRLFAGIRKNGVWQGYGTNFVDYAANTTNTYGTAVTVVPGTQRRFEIKYSGGNMWLAYDMAWIGYFPGSAFAPDTMTNANLFQAFMEEAGPNTQSCSDLGNGKPASDGTAARLGSLNVTGLVPSTTVLNFGASIQPSTAIGYTATSLSSTTVRGGGPGANAALTAVGTTGSC